MERRKFTRGSKLEAVRLIKDRGVSYVQVSQDLNVHTSQAARLGERSSRTIRSTPFRAST
jgi:transposase-like protein